MCLAPELFKAWPHGFRNQDITISKTLKSLSLPIVLLTRRMVKQMCLLSVTAGCEPSASNG